MNNEYFFCRVVFILFIAIVIGLAQALKHLEMVENSLRENAKIVITEYGISTTLLQDSLPGSMKSEKNAK